MRPANAKQAEVSLVTPFYNFGGAMQKWEKSVRESGARDTLNAPHTGDPRI